MQTLVPLRYTINTSKIATWAYVLLLMYIFDNYCSAMWVYLFLHGSYGITWIVKDIIFPDKTWMHKIPFKFHKKLIIILILYWCMPITIAAGYGIQQISQTRKWIVISMYLIGLFLMMASDYQKTTTLAKRKGLISTGFFARTRNPNYFGETLIYLAFSACTGHWISYAIQIIVQVPLFYENMTKKDRDSYSKKEGWDEYKKKSYMFLPKIFPTDIINYVFYALLAGSLLYLYINSQ